MPQVKIELPSLLEQVIAGSPVAVVEADTLEGALRALVVAHPQLEVHLFDETGRFREHVLCFHNGTNTRWLDSLAVPVGAGDEIVIMQAVSGG